MKTPISLARRSELRALAHVLKPVVIIGDKGLTETVLAEIGRALAAHELIKVKAATDERDLRGAWMAEICEKLEAHPVQSIGKILVVWRENPDKKPAVAPAPAPKAKPKAKAKSAKARAKPTPKTDLKDRAREVAKEATRSGRPRSRPPSPLPAPGPLRRRPRTSR
ncbi:MAG: YhbY family RNA-binding protein [Betaproteobacteria bacterium]|nr:YhbY family RNA-binding protein [Betaproteobacteria bacterium]